MPEPLTSFDARPLIAEVDQALIELLRELNAEEWERPAVKAWRVRHVVAHLLDGSLRRLSLDRDGWRVPDMPEIAGFGDLTAWLDDLNAEWTRAADRFSPVLLIRLSEWANVEVQRFFGELDLEDEAGFPVSWAGQDESVVWMDLARELTEKWLHQQQIRDAVDRPGLTEERVAGPVLDTFARALPRAYSAISAPAGTAVRVELTDLPGRRWLVVRGDTGWTVSRATPGDAAAAAIALSAGTAWRLFAKVLSPDQARARSSIEGSAELADPFFSTIAIMG